MRSTISLAVVFGCTVAMVGCFPPGASDNPGSDAGAPGGTTPGTGMPGTPTAPAPAPPAPPPPPAPYVRGSLAALYQLTPRAEYGRIQQNGVSMADADFQALGVAVSASQKMDEIGALPELLGGAQNLIPDAADRQRANTIPFRGNPTDVKFLSVNGTANIYVPLGGDEMTPGNEVAVVQNNQLLTRVKVGVRPQRLAVHPAGLIFVCNQYSNYISIIDPVSNQPLTRGGKPVEIKTEYFCADMAFVPSGNIQDPDHQFLYVANRWRHSVLKYAANIVRDPLSNRPIDVQQSATPDPNVPNKPLAEVLNVGNNPFRLGVSEQLNAIFVANNKGGEISRIDVRSDQVQRRISINAPSADVVNIQDLLFVPTVMPDRGYLATNDSVPQQVAAAPLQLMGIDGQSHLAHPGALFDNTKAYNFEDLRNGLYQLDFNLAQVPQTNQAQTSNVYYTDDISPEANFNSKQKVLTGAVPTTIVRNAAGTQIFLAEGGSDMVQQLNVNTGARPFTVTKGRVFRTGRRPFGLALNEKANQLLVSDWGGERLEIFDLGSGNRVANIDLGYAQPEYPASNVEKGELFFYNASWSNNGRKTCAHCHFDELDTDGVPYGNGATAPTAPHQVKPNHNLATTDSYFWNGSFGDGNYTSVAFAAQTRTNCEAVEFGLDEGPASDPNARIGDPNNKVTNGQDSQCRPVDGGLGTLANQNQINAVKAAELQIRDNQILQATGLNAVALSRVIDFYSVSELRLPPNPLHQMYKASQLDTSVKAEIDQGKALFQSSGCATCHDPNNTRHPFADGLNHGTKADWISRFINTYQFDARVSALLPNLFPQTFLQANAPSINDHEVNVHLDPIDFFIPFCPLLNNCQEFDDPLVVRGNQTEETRRLNLLITVNLADPDRGFIPGNVRGAPQINTPSLRGVWTQANLLHNGFGRTIKESIVGPGHPSLQQGEFGWAVDVRGNFDVHGATKALSPDQVKALVRYVENIE